MRKNLIAFSLVILANLLPALPALASGSESGGGGSGATVDDKRDDERNEKREEMKKKMRDKHKKTPQESAGDQKNQPQKSGN